MVSSPPVMTQQTPSSEAEKVQQEQLLLEQQQQQDHEQLTQQDELSAVKTLSQENFCPQVKDARETCGLKDIHVSTALAAFKPVFESAEFKSAVCEGDVEGANKDQNVQDDQHVKINVEAFSRVYKELLLTNNFKSVRGAAAAGETVDAEQAEDDSERVFQILDRDGNGELDAMELCTGLSMLCAGSAEEKIKAVFDFVDENGDGVISPDELFKFLHSYFQVIVTPELLQKLDLMEQERLAALKVEEDAATSPAAAAAAVEQQASTAQEPAEQASAEVGEKQPRRYSVERLAGETTDGVFMNSELDKEGNLSVEAFTRWFLTMQNAQEASKASSSEATSSDAVAAAGA